MTNSEMTWRLQGGERLDATNAAGDSWTLDFDPDSGYSLGRSEGGSWYCFDSFPTLDEALVACADTLGRFAVEA